MQLLKLKDTISSLWSALEPLVNDLEDTPESVLVSLFARRCADMAAACYRAKWAGV